MNVALVVIAYNRLKAVERLLGSLSAADYGHDKVDLIISVDKSKTDSVEVFADNFEWKHGEKRVVKHAENMGLRNHIMSQGRLFDQYESLVILEDDIVVAPGFYYFVTQAIEKYSDEDGIAGISLYSFSMNYQRQIPFTPVKTEYDAFFMKCAMSWGQVWMKKQWLAFHEWYEDNKDFKYSAEIPSCLFTWPESSWLKYHTRYCIENNKYFVYPYCSLTTDFSDVGTHNPDSDNDTVYQVPLQYGNKTEYNLPALASGAVRYDGFFEYEGLYSSLGLSADECSIDINGGKGTCGNKRYWLTSSLARYKVLASYGMKIRPAEMNVVMRIPGEDIFLYDTLAAGQMPVKTSHKKLVLFNYHIQNVVSFIRIYGAGAFFPDLIRNFFRKLALKIKRH